MRNAYLALAILALTAAAARAEPAPAVLAAESQRIEVISKVKDCVLAVFVPSGQGGGSGVVISPDGYALSNFHVVLPCGKAMPCGMADGKIYDAVVVGIDPTGDVALIKLFGRRDFPCASLGDSDQTRAGDWVFAMGNPFLLATDLQPTVTYGIVSGVHRYQFPAGTLLEYTDCLQVDASINPGNSGGPLFDAQGRLVGINGRASFEKRGRVNVGAAYAISINQIKNFLGALHGGRIVDHATLGAQVAADADGRVVVTDILETCDAYRRGLRFDDEIISFGGRPISTPNGFKNVLGIFPKGWRVPLGYRHDGKRHDILVRLAGLHNEEELLAKATGRPAAEPMPLPKPDDGRKSPPRGEKRRENRPALRPGAKPPARRELPLPEIVKKHFEEKRGYANYYFNALEQQRVWKAWNAMIDPEAARGAWTLAGRLPRGGEFRFQLTGEGASLRLPVGETKWTADGQLGASLLPDHSGGLLPALYLWRRLASEGLGRFGQVDYYGTAPLAGHEGLVDVLAAAYRDVQCRFYFDPAAGQLLALEMFPNEDADPCEIYFSDYGKLAGHSWPGRIEVRFGDELFAVFEVTEGRVEK
jgi:S1-C subfamily serine protease